MVFQGYLSPASKKRSSLITEVIITSIAENVVLKLPSAEFSQVLGPLVGCTYFCLEFISPGFHFSAPLESFSKQAQFSSKTNDSLLFLSFSLDAKFWGAVGPLSWFDLSVCLLCAVTMGSLETACARCCLQIFSKLSCASSVVDLGCSQCVGFVLLLIGKKITPVVFCSFCQVLEVLLPPSGLIMTSTEVNVVNHFDNRESSMSINVFSSKSPFLTRGKKPEIARFFRMNDNWCSCRSRTFFVLFQFALLFSPKICLL